MSPTLPTSHTGHCRLMISPAAPMDRHKFYWLIDNTLAGSGRPGNWSRRDGDGTDLDAAHTALDADLAWLRARGIRAILTLTETPLLGGALARHDLAGYHLPVP